MVRGRAEVIANQAGNRDVAHAPARDRAAMGAPVGYRRAGHPHVRETARSVLAGWIDRGGGHGKDPSAGPAASWPVM